MLCAFISQNYLSDDKGANIPKEIIVPSMLEDAEGLEEALSYVAGRKVKLSQRVRGHRAKWLSLAKTNAAQSLNAHVSDKQNIRNRFIHLQDSIKLDRQKWHYIELAVDRLVIDEEIDINRVTDSIETALKEGSGLVQILTPDNLKVEYSEQFACVKCGTSLPEIEPRTFSFNSPHGACNACTGLGFKLEVDPDLIFANKDITLSEGAVLPWSRSGTASPWYASLIESL